MGMLVSIGAFLGAILLLVTIHEYGHYWMAQRCGVKILRFSIGFWVPVLRWQNAAGTNFVLGCIPLGGYVKMLDSRTQVVAPAEFSQAFDLKPLSIRTWIVLAGPLANFIAAVVLYTFIAMVGYQTVIPTVGSVEPDSVAMRAGLRSGMTIKAINGETMPSWDDVRFTLMAEIGQRTVLILETDMQGNRQDIALSGISLSFSPLIDPIKTFGIYPAMNAPKHRVQWSFVPALSRSLHKTMHYSVLTLKMMVKMVLGDISLNQLNGPLSIAEGAGKTAQLGFLAFLNFLAFVNISLGVMNCLPIPLLDGGHLLFYAIEGVRGRPLSENIQEISTRFGLGILLVLMIVALYNDVLRFI